MLWRLAGALNYLSSAARHENGLQIEDRHPARVRSVRPIGQDGKSTAGRRSPWAMFTQARLAARAPWGPTSSAKTSASPRRHRAQSPILPALSLKRLLFASGLAEWDDTMT